MREVVEEEAGEMRQEDNSSVFTQSQLNASTGNGRHLPRQRECRRNPGCVARGALTHAWGTNWPLGSDRDSW